jgi:4-amino-4-deoxy-L-arabinose transferase-like glycosyltransferase
MHKWRKATYELVVRINVTILLIYGSVAILLSSQAALLLKIVPTLLIGLACLVAIVCYSRNRFFAPRDFERPGEGKILLALLALGVLLRVSWYMEAPPESFGDYQTYFDSAQHLVKYAEYRIPEKEGLLKVYRPPGTAFLLAAVMKMVGIHAWIPVLLNCLCFCGMGWLIWLSVRPKLPLRAAAGTVALLVMWPSDVMTAGLAQSESPSIFGMALLVYILSRRGEGLMRWAVLTGLVTGLICLVRNSSLILLPLWILVILHSDESLGRCVKAAVVIVLATMLPILPWTMRNYALVGVPVLVAANGGENLYTANNDMTDGASEATASARVKAFLPDEVKMDRLGYQYATEWIRSHPAGFLKLAVKKLRILMTGDEYGLWAAIFIGRNYDGRWMWLWRILSDGWWTLVWGLVFAALRYRVWVRDRTATDVIGLVAIPALLFLVFQSQTRYHALMVPPLAYISGYGLSLKRVTQAGT